MLVWTAIFPARHCVIGQKTPRLEGTPIGTMLWHRTANVSTHLMNHRDHQPLNFIEIQYHCLLTGQSVRHAAAPEADDVPD
jgi:hypothetical protein